MMEEERVMEAEALTTKAKFAKEAEYPCDIDDFVLPGELTVTITLHEYKRLLNGIKDKQEIISRYYAKNEKLQQEVADLTAKLKKLTRPSEEEKEEEKEEEEE